MAEFGHPLSADDLPYGEQGDKITGGDSQIQREGILSGNEHSDDVSRVARKALSSFQDDCGDGEWERDGYEDDHENTHEAGDDVSDEGEEDEDEVDEDEDGRETNDDGGEIHTIGGISWSSDAHPLSPSHAIPK